MKYLLSLILVMFLVGCGGGGSQSTAPNLLDIPIDKFEGMHGNWNLSIDNENPLA